MVLNTDGDGNVFFEKIFQTLSQEHREIKCNDNRLKMKGPC